MLFRDAFGQFTPHMGRLFVTLCYVMGDLLMCKKTPKF